MLADQSEDERGGPDSILSRQSHDHERLDALMRTYRAAVDPQQKASIFTELSERALRHAFAKETALFPSYRQHLLDNGEWLTGHIEGEHQEINDLLEQLQDMDPRSVEYDAKALRVLNLIGDDARNEEDVLLPRLQQAVGVDELRTIGQAWEAARSTTPTRPHPRLSRRPPGNVLAAGPLAVWDRLRDAVDAGAGSKRSSVAAGLVAGVTGVAAMTVTEMIEQAFTGRPNSYMPARTLSRLLGCDGDGDGDDEVAPNHVMHWGQGAVVDIARGSRRPVHATAPAPHDRAEREVSTVMVKVAAIGTQSLAQHKGLGNFIFGPPWWGVAAPQRLHRREITRQPHRRHLKQTLRARDVLQLVHPQIRHRRPDQLRHLQQHLRRLGDHDLTTFARDRLIATGQLDTVARLHAAYYLEQAQPLETGARRGSDAEERAAVERDLDNYRDRLTWTLGDDKRPAHDIDTGVELCSLLARLWATNGYLDEGEYWLERALALKPTEDDPVSLLLS